MGNYVEAKINMCNNIELFLKVKEKKKDLDSQFDANF